MKRNFIIHHFLVESKPHERKDLLIGASINIYWPFAKPRPWNIGIGTGTDITNAIISSSTRPMFTKPSRVVI